MPAAQVSWVTLTANTRKSVCDALGPLPGPISRHHSKKPVNSEKPVNVTPTKRPAHQLKESAGKAPRLCSKAASGVGEASVTSSVERGATEGALGPGFRTLTEPARRELFTRNPEGKAEPTLKCRECGNSKQKNLFGIW